MGSSESSWSVFCFFSSAITRIVSTGTNPTKAMLKVPSAYSKFAMALLMLYSIAPMPINSSKNAAKTYAISP